MGSSDVTHGPSEQVVPPLLWYILYVAVGWSFAARLRFELYQCYMQQISLNIIDDLMRARRA